MRTIALRFVLAFILLAGAAALVIPRLPNRSPTEPSSTTSTSSSAASSASQSTNGSTLPTSTSLTSQTTTLDTTPTTTTAPEIAVTFAAGGDLGATERTSEVLTAIGESGAEFMLAIGDLSYSHIEPESAWCDWASQRLGPDMPMQVVVGNHEDDGGPDGLIGNFAACMPDRMNSSGKYGVQYYFDVDTTVRIIMIAADTRVDGEKYKYEPGSDQEQWLIDAVKGARQAGIPWVIVASHKPCLSVGEKRCESGEHLAQLLVDLGVDLVLYGHDHNYQRTYQLTCITENSFDPDCVATESDELVAGSGTVFVTAGVTGRTGMYQVDPNDSEAGYFAAFLGPDNPEAGNGYVEIAATPRSLELRFVGVTSGFSDRFVIRN